MLHRHPRRLIRWFDHGARRRCSPRPPCCRPGPPRGRTRCRGRCPPPGRDARRVARTTTRSSTSAPHRLPTRRGAVGGQVRRPAHRAPSRRLSRCRRRLGGRRGPARREAERGRRGPPAAGAQGRRRAAGRRRGRRSGRGDACGHDGAGRRVAHGRRRPPRSRRSWPAIPSSTWDGDRPLVDDLATARAIRAELGRPRDGATGGGLDALRAEVEALGGTHRLRLHHRAAGVRRPSGRRRQAPSSRRCRVVERSGSRARGRPSMSTAGPAVQANWTGGAGDQGNGRARGGGRVPQRPQHRRPGRPGGRLAQHHRLAGVHRRRPSTIRPGWPAPSPAAAARPGVAPGAAIVARRPAAAARRCAATGPIIAAADWAASAGRRRRRHRQRQPRPGHRHRLGGGTALLRLRWSTRTAAWRSRPPATTSTFGHWDIVSPGTGYNVLTVGGIDDRGTGEPQRRPDLVRARARTAATYRDRTGRRLERARRLQQAERVGAGGAVRTANGLGASGTSVATPIVAGIAAQLLARAQSLALRPEGTRALIMAGAINRVPMPDGSRNADHEGIGTASAMWANRILNAGDGTLGRLSAWAAVGRADRRRRRSRSSPGSG